MIEKTKNIDVSIVIVNWNTARITCDCLESVYQQTKNSVFEVILVDNASSDDSVEMIKDKFPRVILIENKENNGFATANNQAMAIAKGRYILLLNSDTVVLDNAIEKVISFADSRPQAGIVGCRVLNPDKTLQPTCFMFPSILNMLLSTTYLYKLFLRNKFCGREGMTWWDREDEREVDVVTGCFMLVSQKAIEDVGVMDAGFFMYGEETDWCYRFKEAGWEVIFTPCAEIIHLGGQSSKNIRVNMLIQLRISILRFMKKHYGWLTYRIACFLVIAFFMIRVPAWSVIALFCKQKQVEARDRIKAYSVGIKKVLVGFHLF